MTTTRKWSLGAAVIVVLILVATWFLLVSPKRGEAADLQAATAAQDNENSSLETELAVLREQNKKLPKYQAELVELRNRVPQTNAMPGFIRQLTAAADNSGVELKSLTPAPAVPLSAESLPPEAVSPEGVLPGGKLAGVNVDIIVTGGFFEIQQFANKLENLERYALVVGLTIDEAEAVETEEGSRRDGSGEPAHRNVQQQGVSAACLKSTQPVAPTTDPQS